MNNTDIDQDGQPLSVHSHLHYSQVAEQLFEQGFWPVPLTDEKKKPAVYYRNKKKGFVFSEKGLSMRQIREWAKKFPNANVGTVVPPGKVCLDFDAAIPSGIHLPLTPIAVTRRGEHHWHDNPYNFRKTKLVIKGQTYGDLIPAGYVVVMPPSLLNQHLYEWAEHASPDDLDFSPVPEWTRYAEKKEAGKQEVIDLGTNRTISCYSLLDHGLPDFTQPRALFDFCYSPNVLRHLLRFLGVPDDAEPDGSAFPCILPGHKENNPSASLFTMNRGNVAYHDWHNREGKEWFSLPEVYASQLHGKAISFKSDDPEQNWSEFTHVIWQARLLIESGLLKLPRPAIIPSGNAPEAAQKIADGLSLLFACHWLIHPNVPVPFTWRFAKLWCGIGSDAAEAGMKSLFEEKLIKVTGTIRIGGRETNLYLPTGVLSYDPVFGNSLSAFDR